MTERCLTLGCPEVVRVALQDPCTGLPECGVGNGYAISCIRNWTVEPLTREGEASEFISDCGNIVNRDRQDDQLMGYTISFESSARMNELEALLTGKEIISDGVNSIGTYGIGGANACDSTETDPRLIIEIFYKLAQCVTGADHVRWVLPLGQFKVTEIDREGTLTFYRYTAETSQSLANAFGDGPYHDFPADATAFLALQPADAYTNGFDFEETIEISGACGSIDVVCEDLEVVFTSASSPDCGILEIVGENLDQIGCIGLKLPTNTLYSNIPGDPRWTITPTLLTLNDDPNIGGTTITEIIGYIPTGCGALDFATNPGNSFDEIVNIPVVQCVNATEAASPECERFTITGIGFDLVDHIRTAGDFFTNYYDPAGAKNGLNPGTATINSWTDTLIDITDTAQGGEYFVNVEMWGPGGGDGSPAYGTFLVVSGPIADCPEFALLEASGDCEATATITITGTETDDLGVVNLNVDTTGDPFGTVDQSFSFYNPASQAFIDYGPNAAGVTIVTWDSTTIEIDIDTTLYPFDITTWGIVSISGYDLNYDLQTVPDFTVNVDPCPEPEVAPEITNIEQEGDILRIEGTNLDPAGFDALGLFWDAENNVFNFAHTWVLTLTPTVMEFGITDMLAYFGDTSPQELSQVEFRDNMGNPLYTIPVTPFEFS